MDSLQLKVRVSLFFIAILFSPHAWSASAPEYSLGLGVDATRFYYREFDNNDVVLNTEKGVIPGLVINAAIEWERWYTEFNYQYNFGKVEYDGQTQTGIPVTTDTEEDIVDVNLLVGRYFGDNARYRSVLYAGLGYYYWERNILPLPSVAGLLETYEWSYAIVGGKFSLLKASDNGLFIDARLRRMLNATMEVNFLGYRNWDNLDLDLGEEWSFRVGVPYVHSLDKNASLNIEPYLSTWFIGRSADKELTSGGTPVGISAHEPRSETINLGITVKYLYQF